MISHLKTKIALSSAFLLALPFVSLAQFGGNTDMTSFGAQIITFINGVLVPFVFAVALLLFIYGMYLYFIQGADEPDTRDTGKTYLIWSIVALVLMVSVWGITNLIAGGFGFDDDDAINSLIPKADLR